VAQSAGQAFGETQLKGAGATFPYPLYNKWFKEYGAVDPAVTFSYEAVGSGGGIRQILAQTVDFGASDKFLTDEELKTAPAPLLQIPTVMGAVAVTYNLPGIGSGLRLTPSVLSEIFSGKITRWNNPRITAVNKGRKLPDREIVVVHRSDSSGTSYVFTEYLSSVSRAWAKEIGKGTTVNWPVGIGAKGSSEVVRQVTGTPFTIGYVEIAYVLDNNLPAAALKNRAGSYVKPTMKSTRAAGANALQQIKGDYRVSLVNQPGKDAYPIAAFTWLFVYQHQQDREKGRKLVEFLNWELRKAEKMTSTLFYVPLPEELANMVAKTIANISY
jgi:phosphate transport system substrate-binding protein